MPTILNQIIINIIKRNIKPTEQQKHIKLIIYYTKFKTSNLIVKNNTNSPKTLLNQTNVVYKFICPLCECIPKNKFNTYIGHTTTTLFCRLTYHLSDTSAIKQQIITKHNSPDLNTSSNIRKILTKNTTILYKNNNKKRLQILEALCIKKLKKQH